MAIAFANLRASSDMYKLQGGSDDPRTENSAFSSSLRSEIVLVVNSGAVPDSIMMLPRMDDNTTVIDTGPASS